MRQRSAVACAGVVVLASTACGSGTSEPSAGSSDPATASDSVLPGTQATSGARCVVRLHGKGGTGGASSETDGIVQVLPTGNADGWGGRQWVYFPDESYADARDIVAAAATEAGCTRLVLNGFSNGAAFTSKLFCRGETFDGRLVGVVIDDPVPDNGVAGCTPPADVPAALYWTGGLDPQAEPGADCAAIDWTCDGGTLLGIEAYAAALGLDIQPSPFSEHEWYVDAPEISAWLGG
jgi:pimeloyl-ACP methyl ester carboxylesterase